MLKTATQTGIPKTYNDELQAFVRNAFMDLKGNYDLEVVKSFGLRELQDRSNFGDGADGGFAMEGINQFRYLMDSGYDFRDESLAKLLKVIEDKLEKMYEDDEEFIEDSEEYREYFTCTLGVFYYGPENRHAVNHREVFEVFASVTVAGVYFSHHVVVPFRKMFFIEDGWEDVLHQELSEATNSV